jgi:hypothetical protein
MTVDAVAPEVALDEHLPGAQFADAYRIAVDDAALDARLAAKRMFGRSPRWIAGLMTVRNHVVAPFGLKTPGPKRIAASDTIGLFPVVSQSPNRLVAGFDDKHLDFRVIVDVSPAGGGRSVTATTLVRTHNLLGRLYLATVLPFHRIIVRSMLRRLSTPSRGRPGGGENRRIV